MPPPVTVPAATPEPADTQTPHSIEDHATARAFGQAVYCSLPPELRNSGMCTKDDIETYISGRGDCPIRVAALYRFVLDDAEGEAAADVIEAARQLSDRARQNPELSEESLVALVESARSAGLGWPAIAGLVFPHDPHIVSVGSCEEEL